VFHILFGQFRVRYGGTKTFTNFGNLRTLKESINMSSQNRGALFLAGLVMGGVVGAGLALLLAPQSGEETRLQIRDKSFELKDGATESLTEAGNRAQAQVAAWQEKGQEVSEAISRSKDSLIQAVSQSKDRDVETVG
jgi:gas vesicle protein